MFESKGELLKVKVFDVFSCPFHVCFEDSRDLACEKGSVVLLLMFVCVCFLGGGGF